MLYKLNLECQIQGNQEQEDSYFQIKYKKDLTLLIAFAEINFKKNMVILN
jgi:hypothetical protein